MKKSLQNIIRIWKFLDNKHRDKLFDYNTLLLIVKKEHEHHDFNSYCPCSFFAIKVTHNN